MTHSFPTRRSSDLKVTVGLEAVDVARWSAISPLLPTKGLETALLETPPTPGLEAAIVARTAELIAMRERQIVRSEEHTSELQSLMRISYAVFCLKKKKQCQKTKP